HHADGKIAGNAAADLEKSDGLILAGGAIPVDQQGHLFEAGLHHANIADIATDAIGNEDIPERGIFPAGREDRQIFLAGRIHPGIFGIDFVEFADVAVADELIHVFVREVALALVFGLLPILQHLALDAAHGFFLGNAGIGHAVHPAFAKRELFVIGQIAVVGNAAVVIVRDEIKNIFFEVGA